jgi:hypothetical protein
VRQLTLSHGLSGIAFWLRSEDFPMRYYRKGMRVPFVAWIVIALIALAVG